MDTMITIKKSIVPIKVRLKFASSDVMVLGDEK
jgi:hypothetical protein